MIKGQYLTELILRNHSYYHKGLKFAKRFGMEELFYKTGYFLFRIFPTQRMINSRQYYKNNRYRISKIHDYLYDEKSKDVYMKVISFRANMDYRRFPEIENSLYFVESIIKLSEHEVFIDGGGYIGDTVVDFIRKVKNRYERIVVFEPDKKNYALMKENIGAKENIFCYNKGLYSKTTRLPFIEGRGAASRVDDAGESTIPVVAIDDIEECKNATFIKLDIEGGELNALYGAKRIITTNTPKLAICLYHSDADMLDIIEYVHKLVPKYKLYIRHHSKLMTDTILYAVP